MSISIFILRPWKSEKHQRVPLWKWKKNFVSDFYEIQNMQSLWPKDFTHKIWVESETKNFFWCKGGDCDDILKIRKIPKGPPLEKKKLSPTSLKFYVWDPETIRISDFEFHHKKNFFDFFPFSPNAWGPSKIFDVRFFQFFFVKNVKSSFIRSWQIPKGTKSWNLVTLTPAP